MTKEVFSTYRPPVSFATIPVESKTLEEVWKVITGDTLKENTEHLRELIEKNRIADYKKDKGGLLPSVSFGGVFDYRHTDPQSYRKELLSKLETETDTKELEKIKRDISLLEGKKGLLSSSGLVTIDIDHIKGQGLSLEELRDSLSADKELGLRLLFVSPSGDGLKLICKSAKDTADPQSYTAIYESLRYYINTHYGEIVDRSGKDITRLCFLCYDPLAKMKDTGETFHPELHPLPEEKGTRQETTYKKEETSNTGEDGIEEIVRRVEESGIDIAPDRADYFPLACAFSALGERGRSLLHRVCRLSTKYDPVQTDKDFNYGLQHKGEQEIGYFINLAKSRGINTFDYNNKRGGLPFIPNMKPNKKTPQTAPETPEYNIEDYTTIPDLGKIVEEKLDGIRTGYIFYPPEGGEEDFILPSGTLTLICGKPSHCKSKLLQNIALKLALDMSDRQEEGSVLFFTYEEALSAVLLQFANIYANIPDLSRYKTRQTEVIKDYYTLGKTPRCKGEKREELQRKLRSFKTFFESGKLRVYYSNKYSQTLCSIIRELASQMKVKAVFIDYVQLLDQKAEGKGRKERRVELRDIAKNDLQLLAIDLGIPVVLTAQLSKQATSPTDMSSEDIAESYDIARFADTIACLWNSAKIEDVKDPEDYIHKSSAYGKLTAKGFELGTPGKLYIKLTKNREGTAPLDGVFNFTGSTGDIHRQGTSDPEETDLFNDEY